MKSIGRYQNQSSNKGRRRKLRQFQTTAEKKLWSRLRDQQLGVKFRRQYNIDHYVVDFYCHSYRLVVELDGWYHATDEQQAYDRRRDAYMIRGGYRVLRYQNVQVFREMDAVLQDIINHLV